MNKSDFILFIPGIIYGVALVDLLKIFRHKHTYWEVTGWGIMMILNLVVSWFNLYDKLETISSNMLIFTLYLVSPLLFAQAVFVLTPEEEDTDTKAYFMKTNRLYFILLLAYIIINSGLALLIAEDAIYIIMRAIIALPFLVIIIWQKVWMRRLALLLYGSFAAYIYLLSVL